ncbi:hypothetical protein SmJEL517_g05139 [Synchytrium microbalum]|uniref:ubiquitinyl hydrolase 1 n=1 Tax=Synchytrium microbalum TaxID=1806994 RepID=A0A507C1Z9_9FUNG|nr:uncharacterized protein SmJEL517_g05139 [Synchytrium microbalum]TPX31523.1 hypothetical protein SmJEL517_g05139 [Synchytrium microbalum]
MEEVVAVAATPPAEPMETDTPVQPVPDVMHLGSATTESQEKVLEEKVYEWKIESFSSLRQFERTHSDEFECYKSKWRILLFPNGNRQTEQLSVFLESVDAPLQDKKSSWHMCVEFSLAVANLEDDTIYKHQSARMRFNPTETDWGFNQMVKFAQLTIPIENFAKPILENDKMRIVVYMRVVEDPTGVLWHNFIDYDSKKETGFVGLHNQGATCYMNSLLQSLYFTNYFRKATYAIPTDSDEPQKSIPLALQRVFYNLQFSDQPVGTIELTKSFGWDALDSFMQHDVQEFNRVLQDNLESKMKGTQAEGAITRLFVGKMKSYIKCIDVQFESSRVEDYYDVQLNVKGCKNLQESFDNYVSVETMDGENKYAAEGYGLQDARKGVIFKSFPPVLHLQLKRFEYDMQKDALVKINDRHEFPLEIDLDQYLSADDADVDRTIRQHYHLHGVLVHTGDVHGGHYCAYLRPQKLGKWYKFDDDRVVPVQQKEVLDENYGGESGPTRTGGNNRMLKRLTNAYMLVYIREQNLDEMLSEVTENDIPSHLRQRLEQERMIAEQKRKEKEEAHLFMSVKILTDTDARNHDAFDLCNFDDKSHALSNLTTHKVRKDEIFSKFKALLCHQMNLAPEQVRLWTMVGRQNKTVRPDAPIAETEYDKTLEAIREKYSKTQPELRLYLEQPDPELLLTSPKGPYFMPKEDKENGQIIIFLKFYDPKKQKIEYAGKLTVKSRTMKISDVLPIMAERVDLPPNTPLKLFEEVKPTMIDPLKFKQSFAQAELGDGDIICYQKEVTDQEMLELPDQNLAHAPAYFDAILNRITVAFRPKTVGKDVPSMKDAKDRGPGDFELVLSKKMAYDLVAQAVADKLGRMDPMKIRFSSNAATSSPKQVIKRQANMTLQEMIPPQYQSQITPILFYEILDISITELETKRYIKVCVLDRSMKELATHDVLLLKTANVSDLLEVLKAKIKLDDKVKVDEGSLRLYEVTAHKIHKMFANEDLLSSIVEYSYIYAEETPLDELRMAEGDKIVNAFHFSKDLARAHSIPFRFVLRAGEMFSATKARLQARIGMNDKDFAKAKVVYVGTGTFPKMTPVEDGDILCDKDYEKGECIAIDHIDKSRNARSGTFEKAIKIFG